MSFRVSFVSAVRVLSGLRSVVIWVGIFLFPAASLYTSFQGLAEVVRLQYSFHDLVFSRLIVAAYLAFSSKYLVLHASLSSALCLVL
jgi:hypothetical protein